MISFRYHLVSIAAVLIALAAGVALGSGPLQRTTTADDGENLATVDIAPALAGFEAAWTKAGSETVIENELEGASVIIFTTPSARDGEVKSLAEYIEAAAGEVVGQVTLTSKLLDPANRQFAESVASQSAGSAAGTGEDYHKVGSALGAAFVSEESGDPSTEAMTIRSAFVEGGLIEVVQEPEATATIVLIVTGPANSQSAGEGVVLSNAVSAIDSAGDGVVVAGPASAGTDDGVIAAIRDSAATGSVSTVDVTDLGSGRVLTIVALARERAGTSGSWGTSNAADGPVPR